MNAWTLTLDVATRMQDVKMLLVGTIVCVIKATLEMDRIAGVKKHLIVDFFFWFKSFVANYCYNMVI